MTPKRLAEIEKLIAEPYYYLPHDAERELCEALRRAEEVCLAHTDWLRQTTFEGYGDALVKREAAWKTWFEARRE